MPLAATATWGYLVLSPLSNFQSLNLVVGLLIWGAITVCLTIIMTQNMKRFVSVSSSSITAIAIVFSSAIAIIGLIIFCGLFQRYIDIFAIGDGPNLSGVITGIHSTDEFSINLFYVYDNGVQSQGNAPFPIGSLLFVYWAGSIFGLSHISAVATVIVTIFCFFMWPIALLALCSTPNSPIYSSRIRWGFSLLVASVSVYPIASGQIHYIIGVPTSIFVSAVICSIQRPAWRIAFLVIGFFLLCGLHPSCAAGMLVIVLLNFHPNIRTFFKLTILFLLVVALIMQLFRSEFMLAQWSNMQQSESSDHFANVGLAGHAWNFTREFVFGFGGNNWPVSGVIFVSMFLVITLLPSTTRREAVWLMFPFMLLLSSSVSGLSSEWNKLGYISIFWYQSPQRITFIWTAALFVFFIRAFSKSKLGVEQELITHAGLRTVDKAKTLFFILALATSGVLISRSLPNSTVDPIASCTILEKRLEAC